MKELFLNITEAKNKATKDKLTKENFKKLIYWWSLNKHGE